MRRHRHEGQGGLTGNVVCHSSCLPQDYYLPSRLALWKGDTNVQCKIPRKVHAGHAGFAGSVARYGACANPDRL
jgi:hypothetical protein